MSLGLMIKPQTKYLETDSDEILPLLLRDVDDEPGAEVIEDVQRNRMLSEIIHISFDSSSEV